MDNSVKPDINKLKRSKIPVLYYAGTCPKCRFLSKLVVRLSLNTIKRFPLEKDKMIEFYYIQHPEAKGYPVLFIGEKAILRYKVFFAVPFVIVLSWLRRIKGFQKREKPGMITVNN
jgi:glutaredoxin-related protein